MITSRKKEIDGLVSNQVFQSADSKEVPEGTGIYGKLFVDIIN